jgi:hypothetical protein
MMSADLSPTVFPVHARADIQRVRPVVEALRSVGVDVWMEAERLSPGSNWQNQTTEAIDASRGALVFISPSLVASEFALHEVRALYKRGIPIIPWVIERVGRLPPTIEFLLGYLQQIDMTGSVLSVGASAGVRPHREPAPAGTIAKAKCLAFADQRSTTS